MLLNALSQNDEMAFKTLFTRYFPRVKRFILNLLQDSLTAEDLSQDIFLKIWQNRGSASEITNLNAYMYSASRNAVHQYLRRKVVADSYAGTHDGRTDDIRQETNIENDLFADDLLMLITYTVDNMPQQRKNVYNLSRINGYTNDEIAEKLSISKRTVENHLTAALADIRKVLRNFFIF